MTDTVISSATREVVLGLERPFVMIGERINPTGRKILAAEMAAGNFSRVESDALAQIAAGAHMLDVNAGIPLADEPAILANRLYILPHEAARGSIKRRFERIDHTFDDQAREGRNLCVELIQEIRAIPGVHGVHVMAYRQEEAVAEIIQRSGVLGGRVPWDPGRDPQANTNRMAS